MQRLLVILITVTFVAATAAPVMACVSGDVGAVEHACCGQQPVMTAPAGPCCSISLPPGRPLLEVRTAIVKQEALEPVVARDVSWVNAPHDVVRKRHRDRDPRPRGVPLYLEQLTLLI